MLGMERITVMCDWIVSSECSITLNVDTDTGICRITASIGVVVTPDAGSDFEMLYRNADMALYQGKTALLFTVRRRMRMLQSRTKEGEV